MNIFKLQICDLLERVNVNRNGVFERHPKLISLLPQKIKKIIGDDKVYISEFIIAKVKGRIYGLAGHPHIVDEIIVRVPDSLLSPTKIMQDHRDPSKIKYLFIINNPLHQIVIELNRHPSGLTEINTIFETYVNEIKRLEALGLTVVFTSGGTPSPAYVPLG